MMHFDHSRQWNFHVLKPWRFYSPASLIFTVLISLFSFSVQALATHNYNDKKSTVIIYPKTQGFSQQLVEQLEQDITRNGYHVHKMFIAADKTLSQSNLSTLHDSQLLITVGSRITELLLKININKPILSVLIPRHIASSLHNNYPQNNDWSCLLIDQPIKRQLNLVNSILGEQNNTGILLGPFTNKLKSELETLSSLPDYNIKIKTIPSIKQLPHSLTLLNQVTDVLLTLPDPVIYNQNTIQGILLSAYREKRPIIGFSKAYVKAGAIAAIYSKPKQISTQLSSIINHFFKHNKFEKNHYFPNDFSIALNTNTARSLGIKLDTENAIIKKIKMAETVQ